MKAKIRIKFNKILTIRLVKQLSLIILKILLIKLKINNLNIVIIKSTYQKFSLKNLKILTIIM
jgi:hypothetical protein